MNSDNGEVVPKDCTTSTVFLGAGQVVRVWYKEGDDCVGITLGTPTRQLSLRLNESEVQRLCAYLANYRNKLL